jgi:OHCU decarboxylase
MRGNPESHQLIAASSLPEALAQLADSPGAWTPIAGGTELMVAHAAGRLNTPRLISLWGLPELCFIRVSEEWISIGGGVTFAQIRRNATITADFPLLSLAASWIGSIANQSRATLAGNIVNGSPAADAPPALLVYDAEIELISQRGSRRIPYTGFHLGYKQSILEPDELVLALHLPRRFAKHTQYLRKVGTRKAMAITKVALAGTAIISDNRITEIRLAAASVADRPVRMMATEDALTGSELSPKAIHAARMALLSEVRPIDDIRSTAEYRKHVAANLLDEFLHELTQQTSEASSPMNPILSAWNTADTNTAVTSLLNCCAAQRWARAVAAQRPCKSEEELFTTADSVWAQMEEPDWMEAFRAHPRIGERKAAHASAQSTAWSKQEQASTDSAQQDILSELAAGNETYEKLFGFTYIVCATGKSAEEMLQILRRRLSSDRATELREAAEQQRQITQIRLRKWLEI